jgi:hypothetical protein
MQWFGPATAPRAEHYQPWRTACRPIAAGLRKRSTRPRSRPAMIPAQHDSTSGLDLSCTRREMDGLGRAPIVRNRRARLSLASQAAAGAVGMDLVALARRAMPVILAGRWLD